MSAASALNAEKLFLSVMSEAWRGSAPARTGLPARIEAPGSSTSAQKFDALVNESEVKVKGTGVVVDGLA
jgi:hypothetical protein